MTRAERLIWTVAVAALLAVRLATLSGPLDEPSWRQSWCAHHAREVSREWPSNWLANYINFRGPEGVSFWTLPLYETIVAIEYRIAGREALTLARATTLLCYAWAAYLLFLIAAELFDRRVAMYAALAFWALPLGIFYSRAVHYEALLIALSHAFLLASLRFCRAPSRGRWMAAVAAGSVAALIKPTFIMWMGPAALAWALVRSPRRKLWALGAIAALFALPFAAAVWHHFYRLSFEGAIANTALYADPYNPVYAKSWFLGSFGERLGAAYWREIVRLTVWLVLTPGGALLAAGSLLTLRRRDMRAGWWPLAAWFAGLAIYTLAFTRIVATHDYWRLPFMAPLALTIGLALDEIAGARESGRLTPLRAGLLAAALLVLAAGIRPSFRRGPYFERDWQRIIAGEAIREHTGQDELVVSTAIGRSTGGTDPRILYHADRRGWATRIEDFSEERFDEYAGAGASAIAMLVTPEQMPPFPQWDWMVKCRPTEWPLKSRDGRDIGSLFIYRPADCER